MMKRMLLAALAALSMVLAAPGAPLAQGGAPGGVADVSILPGWRTGEGTHLTALRIRLAPGWKTYWRAPGEGGIPPRFDWSASRNLGGVEFHWPVPEVFRSNGMRTLGYAGEVIVPIELTPRDAAAPIGLRADVAMGVCQDVCMPMAVQIAADLGMAGTADPRIRAALAAQPEGARAAGVTGARCRVEPISDGLRITAHIAMPPLGPDEIAVFEHPDQSIWVTQSQVRREGGALVAVTEMVPPTNRPFALDRSRLRITVLGGGRAVDIAGCTG